MIVTISAITALLIPGSTNSHSKFLIPIHIDEELTCNIKQSLDQAGLIIDSKFIIWDEAPITNKHYSEAIDRSFRDIIRFSNPNSFNQPFGGKFIVFGGDFR